MLLEQVVPPPPMYLPPTHYFHSIPLTESIRLHVPLCLVIFLKVSASETYPAFQGQKEDEL